MERIDLSGSNGVRDKPQFRGSRPIIRERWEPVDTAGQQPRHIREPLLAEEASEQFDLSRRHRKDIVVKWQEGKARE